MRHIEYLAVEELKPAKRNPKKHLLPAIKASFQRFGYVDPVVLDERTGRLVSGHGRREELIALRAEGVAAPEGVKVEGETWFVPVLRGWQSKDDDEALAFLLASNKLTEAGGWDQDVYADIVAELESRAGKLEDIGWTRSELDQIAASIEARNGVDSGGMDVIEEKFMVMVECTDERQQAALLERLTSDGFVVRALMS